jgi:hypothetical protein
VRYWEKGQVERRQVEQERILLLLLLLLVLLLLVGVVLGVAAKVGRPSGGGSNSSMTC